MSDSLQQDDHDVQNQKPPKKKRKFLRVILTVFCVLIFITGAGIVILANWIKSPTVAAKVPVTTITTAAQNPNTPPNPAVTTTANESAPAVTVTEGPTPTPTLIPPAPDGFANADRKELFYTFLIVGIDSFNNTDTIIVGSYDGVNRTANLIAIPRDCKVDVSRKLKKINAAYPISALNGGKEAGIAQLQKEVKTIIGFVPDFYVLVNFKAVTDTVDAIGGIEIDVPFNMVYNDPEQDLHINLRRGLQNLNGHDALTFARYRKGDYERNVISDYERINNQQTVIKTVMKKLLLPRNLLKIPQFIKIFNDNIFSNITAGNMIWFANEINNIKGTSALSLYTMPTNGSSGEPDFYEYLDEAKVIELVNSTINPYTVDIGPGDVDIIR